MEEQLNIALGFPKGYSGNDWDTAVNVVPKRKAITRYLRKDLPPIHLIPVRQRFEQCDKSAFVPGKTYFDNFLHQYYFQNQEKLKKMAAAKMMKKRKNVYEKQQNSLLSEIQYLKVLSDNNLDIFDNKLKNLIEVQETKRQQAQLEQMKNFVIKQRDKEYKVFRLNEIESQQKLKKNSPCGSDCSSPSSPHQLKVNFKDSPVLKSNDKDSFLRQYDPQIQSKANRPISRTVNFTNPSPRGNQSNSPPVSNPQTILKKQIKLDSRRNSKLLNNSSSTQLTTFAAGSSLNCSFVDKTNEIIDTVNSCVRNKKGPSHSVVSSRLSTINKSLITERQRNELPQINNALNKSSSYIEKSIEQLKIPEMKFQSTKTMRDSKVIYNMIKKFKFINQIRRSPVMKEDTSINLDEVLNSFQRSKQPYQEQDQKLMEVLSMKSLLENMQDQIVQDSSKKYETYQKVNRSLKKKGINLDDI